MSTFRIRGPSRARRGGSNSTRGIARSPRLKGLFDKLWYCDCTPRLPAEQFTVKKQGKNHGRRFYTCQQDQDKRCGFFMWSDEAQAREAQCVLSNSRNEGHSDVQEGWNAGRPRVHFAQTPTQSASTASSTGVKRNMQDAGFEEDEYDEDWDLTGAEVEQLAKAADESVLQTPKKPRIDGTSAVTGVYATPTSEAKRSPRKLPWLQDDPVTPRRGIFDYFKTPQKQTTLPTPGETPAQQQRTKETARNEPTSPSPASPSPSPQKTQHEITLTEEVLQEIGSLPIPPDKLATLKSILKKHEARAEGFRKGRDISRSALKAKEKLLQAASEKIKSLEAERRQSGSRQTSSGRQQMMQEDEEDEETDDEL
ncbi:hypothetical protein CB0940_01723 [Cercospora beticola]|uniref:GRF-type domain-containing protein n=1 Tax=Cercospora beticola TaxID=122368 RepID=A0A2G5I6V6_CERBT|nr:hypothetical protein CB0940_01723 [Cercospora beticola]PIB00520.1 hypothetical protein CB0940_01723 [Cercospora beticola]WPA97170.1 hypothetical protein RHO25_001779 [Cercospora beticola]CAK1354427.1 unnamed protein product [Cercospora beticola]